MPKLVWSDPYYNCTSHNSRLARMEVFWNKNAYSIKINGAELRKTFSTMSQAQEFAEATLKLWCKSTLDLLGGV